MSNTNTKEKKLESLPRHATVVRYGKLGFIGLFRYDGDDRLACGQHVIIHTDRGMEIGQIVAVTTRSWQQRCCLSGNQLQEYVEASGPGYPLERGGKILRPASAQDLNEQQHMEKATKDKARLFRELAEDNKLEIKLVEIEHIFGGDRIIFYFLSEKRVDFRQLVRDLASELQTRIELRQVGARDEAKLVADYERCGQPCCCRAFLKLLKPVSMRMAKIQKASLDPAKISGRCGRLMCCLRYEDETYEDLRRNLPRVGSWVRFAEGIGPVVETQILTQLVCVEMGPEKKVAIGVDDIIERDIPPEKRPSEPQKTGPEKKTASVVDEKLKGIGLEKDPTPKKETDQRFKAKDKQKYKKQQHRKQRKRKRR